MEQEIRNGPIWVPPPGTKLTYEYFNEFLTWPWYINNIYLDEVPSIHGLYRELMIQSESIEEMVETVSLFGFLAWDSKRLITKFVNSSNFIRIKKMIEKGMGGGELSPIVLPNVMLWAGMISKEYGLPEFPAACQYINAKFFRKEHEKWEAIQIVSSNETE